jgi:uncharacterized C2H2 Zn-finger protein
MSEKEIIRCKNCNMIFSKTYTLNRHISKKVCQKLEDELLTQKIVEYNESFNKKIIKCNYCNKLFEKNSKLERHLLSTIGNCYKLRNKKETVSTIINKNRTINNIQNIENQTINNTYNTTVNIQPINIQPVVNNVIFAKPGEETISHITKEIMLEILNIESFPKMCTELMRLLYFNKEVPENQNWTIVYPKNQNAGVEFNHKTLRFERKKTYNIIDDKFSNMIFLLFDLVQEISNEDILNNNLSKRQKININKYGMHFGQLDISKTSKDVYSSIHEFAYNSRKSQMEVWKDNGHKGNHLSLKF